MTREFQWPMRVYIEDTDAGGIVYYVNYLKFLERARTELLRDLGFGKQYIFNQELMFVVTQVALEYRAPAELDDELLACAEIIELKGARLTFRQRVRRGEQILVEGEVQIACVDRHTRRPKRLPTVLRDALDALWMRPGPQESEA